MELATIIEIRRLRDEIRVRIKDLDRNITSTYGVENEYTHRGLIAGIEALLIDISSLTKAPNQFVKISTKTERDNIKTYLNAINQHLTSPPNYLPSFDALKILLRSYGVRGFSDRQIEFENEIDHVLRLKLDFEERLKEVEEIKKSVVESQELIDKNIKLSKETSEQIECELEKVTERKEEITEQSESLEAINVRLSSIKASAEESLEAIKGSTTESKGNEKLISSFASKVSEREKRLEELEQRTTDNDSKLNDYEKEREKVLIEAKELIESAKDALNYKTAEGISASFQEHFTTSKNYWVLGGWIAGAFICMLMTLGLGIWILQGETDKIHVIIGRITLIPMPIVGAIFCARQYLKQKNIIEDYAYKMVISKAIVGFSEQLKTHGTEDKDEYVHYMKTALEEIHQDPLRARGKKNDSKNSGKVEGGKMKEVVELAEKLMKMANPNNN